MDLYKKNKKKQLLTNEEIDNLSEKERKVYLKSLTMEEMNNYLKEELLTNLNSIGLSEEERDEEIPFPC